MRVLLAVFLTLCSGAAWAQVSTAELFGTVADSTGAVIQNAKVTAANADTSVSREVTTDSAGNYIFTLLQPGTYNLTVESPGFRKLVQSGVVLQVNQRARIDLTMQVGQVTETVEVAAAAPLLESQSSSLGSVIDQRFVGELPLNGRNFVQLAILSPGVNGTGFSTSGTIQSGTRPDDRRPGTEIFSNGNREGSNNFLYDGVDNNERLIQLIVYRPAIEAVREFKVQTNMFSADLGRNSGAVVDVVSKSGTNELHGSVFEFLRNSAMDARSFFNVKGTPFPPFRWNQFGFSLGGPVVLPKIHDGRNRTFFFVDYEGYRRNFLNSFQTTIPTLAMRQGDFSGQPNAIYDPTTNRPGPTSGSVVRTPFAGNQIPSNRFDTVTAKLINAYPTPVNASLANNFLANLNQKQDWSQGDVRVDHQFTSNDTFFARWSIQHTTTFAPYTFPEVQIPGVPVKIGVGNEDSFAGPAFNPVQHAVANYTKVLSPRVINEFRAGFNRFVLDYTGDGFQPGQSLGNALGVRNANSHPLHTLFPIFSPAGYTGVGHSRSLPIFRRSNTFQYSDNVTWTSGSHTLKFGGDFRRRQITEYQTNRGNGRFNFSAAYTDGRPGGGHVMASFLLGYASLIEQDYLLAWIGARGVETGWYFADDWRATRKLTLNLGLRWEYYSPYSEVANRWANFDADTATVKIAGRDGVDSRAGVQRDFRNWAPRFGFAYQAGAHTVVRGGYGLFFNPNGNGGALLRLQRHIPFGPIYNFTSNDVDPGPRVSDGLPAAPEVNFASAQSPSGGVIGVFPRYKSAYAQQFNLTVEQEIAPWHALIKLAYVGNLGRRLGTTVDLNQPVPGPGSVASRRPFFSKRPAVAGVTYAMSDGLSNYNALQLTLEKRYSHGLHLLLGYTWAHAIDNVGTEFGGGTGTPQDLRNRNADRGNASFDMRHRMTVSYTYHMPWGKGRMWLNRGGAANWILGGWQTNGILTVQTGLPFTLSLLSPNTGGAGGSRPDRIGDGTLPSSQRSLQRWFDISAFTTTAQFVFGNAGRNILFGPGRTNFDASLFKDFPIREDIKFQFRAEAFNSFNHPQFGQPNAGLFAQTSGLISSTVGTPRQLQLALRFQF